MKAGHRSAWSEHRQAAGSRSDLPPAGRSLAPARQQCDRTSPGNHVVWPWMTSSLRSLAYCAYTTIFKSGQFQRPLRRKPHAHLFSQCLDVTELRVQVVESILHARGVVSVRYFGVITGALGGRDHFDVGLDYGHEILANADAACVANQPRSFVTHEGLDLAQYVF